MSNGFSYKSNIHTFKVQHHQKIASSILILLPLDSFRTKGNRRRWLILHSYHKSFLTKHCKTYFFQKKNFDPKNFFDQRKLTQKKIFSQENCLIYKISNPKIFDLKQFLTTKKLLTQNDFFTQKKL